MKKVCSRKDCQYNGVGQPLTNFYKKRQGHAAECKTCNNNDKQIWRKNNPDAEKRHVNLYGKSDERRASSREYRIRIRREEPARALRNGLRSRCKRRKMEFNLTLEEIEGAMNGKCEISGIPFDNAVGSLTLASPDRIDNNKGYTRDNVRWVCHYLNILRNDRSVEEFTELILKTADFIRHSSQE